jgi:hypothetical protein
MRIVKTPRRDASSPRLATPILSFVGDSARARQRIRVDLIPVRYMAEGREAIGHLKNVSRAGIFVRARELPAPGAAVSLQFRSPSGELVDARGEVCWTTDGLLDGDVPPGFGIRLHEPPRQYWEFLRWVLTQVDEDKGDERQVL